MQLRGLLYGLLLVEFKSEGSYHIRTCASIMNSHASIFFGQPGNYLKESLHNLDRELAFSSSGSSQICLDQEFRLSNSASSRLKRCGTDMVCWLCDCSCCLQNQEALWNQVSTLLEELDYVSSISLVGGCSDPFDLLVVDSILEYLELNCPGISLRNVSLKHGVHTSGMDSYYSTMLYARMKSAATSFTIRGLDDFLYEDEIEASRKTSGAVRVQDLRDYYHYLACDLWPLFKKHDGLSTGVYALWPWHVCTYPRKLFDIRTSIYKTLHKVNAAAKGSRKTVDLVPHRIVSTSLHRLHMCSMAKYADIVCDEWSQYARVASVSNFSVFSERNIVNMDCSRQNNTSAVFNWAAKGLQWIHYEDMYAAENSPVKVDRRGSGVLDHVPLSAACFESPYAELDIVSTYKRARAMLQAGAYAHKLGDAGGMRAEEVMDAANSLEDLVGLYV
ncbi:hypothetical protein EON65_43360 [archaeon]|nr:MAG: hypothetical protein EON65_43360 [archaeon]